MANTLNFEDIAVLLNSMYKQSTGQTAPVATNTKDFVAQAQTTLLSGYDNVINAISQTLSRTIFSIRPYNRKFRGLEMNRIRWGNHVRKINFIDSDFSEDENLPLDDGESIDHYIINKPKTVQTNFYGGQRFMRFFTTFLWQLDAAFQGPDQLASFWGGVVQNITDQRNQAFEQMARMAIANFVGAKMLGDTGNVRHLVTEYNEYAGTSFTSETIKQPANFPNFAKWLFGTLKTIAQFMTERSVKYHLNLTNAPIPRHTPVQRQKFYIYSPVINAIDAQVLADVFNDEYLKLADHESVNYWQGIENPQSLNVLPSYIDANGVVQNATEAVTTSNLFGVIFDEEAIGMTEIYRSMHRTPLNAKGEYYNTFYHFVMRYYNDLTENGVVLLWD